MSTTLVIVGLWTLSSALFLSTVAFAVAYVEQRHQKQAMIRMYVDRGVGEIERFEP